MVSGFFGCQVLAILVWGIIKNRDAAKLIHVVLQTASFITLFIGVQAVIIYKNSGEFPIPNLTTIHSWVGVATVVVFVLNYSLGLLMASLKQFFPNSILRKAFNLGSIHKTIGMASIRLAVLSIVTGVMDQLGQGTCNYIYDNVASTAIDSNPADNYPHYPIACRLANGLAIIVCITAIFMTLSTYLRTFQNISVLALPVVDQKKEYELQSDIKKLEVEIKSDSTGRELERKCDIEQATILSRNSQDNEILRDNFNIDSQEEMNEEEEPFEQVEEEEVYLDNIYSQGPISHYDNPVPRSRQYDNMFFSGDNPLKLSRSILRHQNDIVARNNVLDISSNSDPTTNNQLLLKEHQQLNSQNHIAPYRKEEIVNSIQNTSINPNIEYMNSSKINDASDLNRDTSIKISGSYKKKKKRGGNKNNISN